MIGAALFRAAACILKSESHPFAHVIRVEFRGADSRIIATDGAAMFVARFEDAGNVASLSVDRNLVLKYVQAEEVSRAHIMLARAANQDYPDWRRGPCIA